MKLVVVGYRDFYGGLPDDRGLYGYYWSSTVEGSKTRHLFFNGSNAQMNSDVRAYGFSVRCIKD